MEQKINLVKVKNPFDKYTRNTSTVDYQGETLLEIRNSNFPKDMEVVVSLNGKIIPEYDMAFVTLMPNDYIVFTPRLEGGDNGILRIIAMIVLVIIAIVAPYVAGGIFAAGTLGGSLLSMGIMMIGGMLINALLPPVQAESDSFSADALDSTTSQTYSWNQMTTQQQGLVIPKFYGNMKSTGNIIATYLENSGNSQYLNVLLCHGYGPIKRLYEPRIDKQYTYIYSNVSIENRYGNVDQPMISNFNDTKVDFNLQRRVIYGGPITYDTTGWTK